MEALSKQKKVTLASKATSRYKTPFFGKQTIQKKLEIGSSKDAYEVEADAMANKVVNMSDSQVEQTSQTGMLVQRKCASCEQEEKLQKKSLASEIIPLIQRQSNGEKAGTASQTLSQQINSSKGGGSAMDKGTLTFMESRFGVDFSDVKIHTDTHAVQMSRDLNAQAFTVGHDIYFNEGKYNPTQTSGKHLLAHELTHTIQQKGLQRKIQRRTDTLDESGCKVTLKYKVQLLFKDHKGKTWTEVRKSNFRSNFKSSIENTFNNSDYKIKPGVKGFDSFGTPVKCSCHPNGFKPEVKIEYVPDGEFSVSEDLEADVLANPNGEFIRSSANTSFGYAYLDEDDVNSNGSQTPAVHEFGHFLGFNHPGHVLKKSDLSAGADEYGHKGTDKHGHAVDGSIDLLGSGMGLRPFYFKDWLGAVKNKFNRFCSYSIKKK